MWKARLHTQSFGHCSAHLECCVIIHTRTPLLFRELLGIFTYNCIILWWSLSLYPRENKHIGSFILPNLTKLQHKIMDQRTQDSGHYVKNC